MKHDSVCQLNRLHHLVQVVMLVDIMVGGKCHLLVLVCNTDLSYVSQT